MFGCCYNLLLQDDTPIQPELPQVPDPSGRGSSRSERVTHFLAFIDEKEDDSRKRLKRKRSDMNQNSNSIEDESRYYRTNRAEMNISKERHYGGTWLQ